MGGHGVRYGPLIGFVVAAAIAKRVVALASSANASADSDWTGHWRFTDDRTGGGTGCSGAYEFEIDLVQTGKSVTGTGSSYTSKGAVSGSDYEFTARGPDGCTAIFRMTMSADGKSASGSAEDVEGREFTITAAGDGKPASSKPRTTSIPTASPTPTASRKPTGPPALPQAARPTGRVQSIEGIKEGVAPGTAIVRREGKEYSASATSTLQTGDVILTDDKTFVAVEFLVGGRAGINREAEVEMVNERSGADGGTSNKRMVVREGSIWVRGEAETLKQKIELQRDASAVSIEG